MCRVVQQRDRPQQRRDRGESHRPDRQDHQLPEGGDGRRRRRAPAAKVPPLRVSSNAIQVSGVWVLGLECSGWHL